MLNFKNTGADQSYVAVTPNYPAKVRHLHMAHTQTHRYKTEEMADISIEAQEGTLMCLFSVCVRQVVPVNLQSLGHIITRSGAFMSSFGGPVDGEALS